jgi:hypothetical protein
MRRRFLGVGLSARREICEALSRCWGFSLPRHMRGGVSGAKMRWEISRSHAGSADEPVERTHDNAALLSLSTGSQPVNASSALFEKQKTPPSCVFTRTGRRPCDVTLRFSDREPGLAAGGRRRRGAGAVVGRGGRRGWLRRPGGDALRGFPFGKLGLVVPVALDEDGV